MTEMPRIVTDPAILAGKPHIRGTRISVEHILELIASGGTVGDIAAAYPHLTREDIASAVEYAARFLHETSLVDLEIPR